MMMMTLRRADRRRQKALFAKVGDRGERQAAAAANARQVDCRAARSANECGTDGAKLGGTATARSTAAEEERVDAQVSAARRRAQGLVVVKGSVL